LGPEGGKLDGPTQAVRHTDFKFKMLHISKNPSQFFFSQEDAHPDQRGPVLKHT